MSTRMSAFIKSISLSSQHLLVLMISISVRGEFFSEFGENDRYIIRQCPGRIPDKFDQARCTGFLIAFAANSDDAFLRGVFEYRVHQTWTISLAFNQSA